jgi:ABC-type transport system involved in cytochrome c biogenesis permease subunit
MYNVLFHVILFAYLLASLFFWLSMGLRQRWFFHLAHGLLGCGFALQTLILGYRLYVQTFPWWGEMATSLGLLSWAIVAVYLAAVWRYRIAALGSFIVPLAFLAAAAAGVPVTTPVRLPLAVQHVWLGLHIILALLGYAALTLMFCTGVMYLIQERQLKSKRPGAWYHSLPSLTLLDELNAKALLLGFPFLTQGIITGSVWAKYTYGSYLHWSLTSLPLLLAWFIYALLLGGRQTLGWQGTKAARATVGGFVVVLASYFVHTL